MAERTYNIRISRDEFHDQLSQGIPHGSIVLLEGAYGAGKSILSQRIAYGLLENGYRVTIISTELTVKDFIDQMYSLGYKISSHLLSNRLIFMPVYPLVGRLKERVDFLSKLMRAKEIFASDIIIFDTFSSLVSHSLSGDERSIETLGFFKRLSGLGKSIILTVDPDELDDKVLAHFRSDSQMYLNIVVSQIGDMINRTIVVKRYSNAETRFSPTIGFRVEPNVGLVLEITAVV
ncbi:MAG TPA: AAA family ATPase [Euryarchaeota archaeon]|nr:AAA family ATPase [Euryarchaeota archaeon]